MSSLVHDANERVSVGGPTSVLGLGPAEVAERVARGQVNNIVEATSRTLADIVRANVFTRFNALLGGLCGVVLVLGSYQDAVFGLIIVVNTVIGIVQELRAKRTLDALSVLGAARPRVLREGRVVELDPREVVQDDVLVLAPGDQVVVDGSLTATEGLEVDESLLTGEADPVLRGPGEPLLSGSFVIAGTGAFRATRVGRDAYAARLAAQARRFSVVRSELRDGLDRFLRAVTWFLVPTSALLVTTQLLLGEESLRGALLGSVAGVVTMVPEGLVLLTSIAFAVGVVRLGRRRVLVQELPAIEGLARVDTVCIDKTGTLTEPRMAVSDIISLNDRFVIEDVLAAVAASDRAPNPTMAAIRDRFDRAPGWPTAASVPFSSARKWSGVSFAEGHGIWLLGAPDSLLPEGDSTRVRAGRLAATGVRVLLLAEVERLPVDGIPHRLRPAALVVLEQPLRPDAVETLRYFSDQGVTVRILSGDHPGTVAGIAARLGLPEAGVPLDGRDLPSDPAGLADVAERHTVVGRVTPQQKRDLVHALQSRGHDVAMTGDGVNDVLALKDADIGVAMGNGSGASKAVAQIVLLDSRFADLPAVVAEGRRVLGNIERVAHLFLTKTVYACLMALTVGVAQLPFPFLPRHLTLVSTLTIGVPAFFLALAPNLARVRGGFVHRVLRFSVPAGVVTATASMVTFGIARADAASPLTQDRTVAVITLFLLGTWVLGIVARPLTVWKGALISAMVVLFAAVLALAPTRTFFALDLGAWRVELLTALACAAVGIGLLELALRLTRRLGGTFASDDGARAATTLEVSGREMKAMRLKVKDLVGVVLLAAIAIPYVGYLINGEMPFIKDPRGMAATGLILGAAGFLVIRRGDAMDRMGKAEIALAAVAGALGIAAIVFAETAAAEILLAVFLVAVLALFVVELLDHAGMVRGHRTATPVARS